MTSPENDQAEAPTDGDTGSARIRRRTLVIAAAISIVVLAGALVAGVAVARSSVSSPATAATATSTPDTGNAAPAAAYASATAPATTTDPSTGKVVPPAMSAGQYDQTRTELAALAARLPAHLTLTAPATWAQYAGQTPSYDEDIVSCPHIADRLAADLGARWTYSYGKLPTGPFGCNWTPVPWVPDVSRFFVSIGYQSGTVPVLMQGMDYCMGGVEGPHVDVPAVRQGAVLYGCDDAGGPRYDLAIPDTGGTGVFFLHATGGVQRSPSQVAGALLAVIDGATRAYG
jgi:hypothetical protein